MRTIRLPFPSFGKFISPLYRILKSSVNQENNYLSQSYLEDDFKLSHLTNFSFLTYLLYTICAKECILNFVLLGEGGEEGIGASVRL